MGKESSTNHSMMAHCRKVWEKERKGRNKGGKKEGKGRREWVGTH
jgi:hypothetical protein